MRARNMEELIQKKFDILNENDLQIWAYIVRHKEQCKQISAAGGFLSCITYNDPAICKETWVFWI